MCCEESPTNPQSHSSPPRDQNNENELGPFPRQNQFQSPLIKGLNVSLRRHLQDKELIYSEPLLSSNTAWNSTPNILPILLLLRIIKNHNGQLPNFIPDICITENQEDEDLYVSVVNDIQRRTTWVLSTTSKDDSHSKQESSPHGESPQELLASRIYISQPTRAPDHHDCISNVEYKKSQFP